MKSDAPSDPGAQLDRRETGAAISNLVVPKSPAQWLLLFGPGAIIASLTIGAGELIFSARAGALFGYRLLWFFALILLLKWVLVWASARHMVLTGAHPFQRWVELPGPRGWLPMVLFVLALVCFPIWVSFHAGTVGTLVASLTGTERALHGTAYQLWGAAILTGALILSLTGGYARLERVQMIIVAVMLLSVVATLFLLRPDWKEVFEGLLLPRWVDYPAWAMSRPEFVDRPVWVETVTYVGIIGGSGYDYLAYVAYLRDKQWGRAGLGKTSRADLERIAADSARPHRRWLWAPLIDSAASFVAVLIFSAVFVICGAVVLQPQHKLPAGTDLLSLQAEFVTPIYPWLKHLYFVGAFLAIAGTLYGTIEVAPVVLREMVGALWPEYANRTASRLRRAAVLWSGLGGLLMLIATFVYAQLSGVKTPPGLIAILTPANLFTGVLACGLICLLNGWVELRYVPKSLRIAWPLWVLNVVGGVAFLILGFKAYWDLSRWFGPILLLLTIGIGLIAARLLERGKAP